MVRLLSTAVNQSIDEGGLDKVSTGVQRRAEAVGGYNWAAEATVMAAIGWAGGEGVQVRRNSGQEIPAAQRQGEETANRSTGGWEGDED